MIATIAKRFTFDAAHSLPSLPEHHKCHRLHGHTYLVEIVLRGEMKPPAGFVVDYADIAKAWESIHELVDHRHLNVDVPEIGEPSTENLAVWMIGRLLQHPMMKTGARGERTLLHSVRIKESSTTWCEVTVADMFSTETVLERSERIAKLDPPTR
jgi:6-pyruvoyltetrahydropterin/6-carboxytetrahydropterin synthase